jgi:hypothetical protein
MSNVLEPDTGSPPATPAANRFTPDAQERMARIRAMASEFSDDTEPPPLTPADIRIARQTSLAALEKAAVFAEAAPGVGGAVANAADLRDTIAYELAYAGVRDEARVMARRVDHAILRRKLKAVKLVRGLYRMGKGFVTLDAGDSFKPHVTDMGLTLTPRRRRKPAPPAPGGGPTPAAPK